MKTQMIVNRIDDWFHDEDLELNDCMVSMEILMRLSTRKKAGYRYDRVNLSSTILGRNSAEAIKALDKAIVILFSRKLIFFENCNRGEKKLFITDAGIQALEEYKELMNNVD